MCVCGCVWVCVCVWVLIETECGVEGMVWVGEGWYAERWRGSVRRRGKDHKICIAIVDCY